MKAEGQVVRYDATGLTFIALLVSMLESRLLMEKHIRNEQKERMIKVELKAIKKSATCLRLAKQKFLLQP